MSQAEVDRLLEAQRRKYEQQLKASRAQAEAALAAAIAAAGSPTVTSAGSPAAMSAGSPAATTPVSAFAAATSRVSTAKAANQKEIDDIMAVQIQQLFTQVYGPSTSGVSAEKSKTNPGSSSNISSSRATNINFNSKIATTSHKVPSTANLYPNLNEANALSPLGSAPNKVQEDFVFVNMQRGRNEVKISPSASPHSTPLPSAPPPPYERFPAHASHIFTPITPPAYQRFPGSAQSTPPSSAPSSVQQFKNTSRYNASRCEPSAQPKPTPSAKSAFPQHNKTTKHTARRARPSSNEDEELICITCENKLSLEIFMCPNEHSACKNCRERRAKCGRCQNLITDMRNVTLEAFIAVVSKKQVSCPNKKDGCKFTFNSADIDAHMKECIFNELKCPLSDKCYWKGKIRQIVEHFDNQHPENRQGHVDTELNLLDIEKEEIVLHLINLGPFHFLLYLKTDPLQRIIYVAAQLLCSSNTSASKWIYEIQVYNKREPRRKLTYSDICHSYSTPIDQIFRDSKCITISMSYAMTYFSEGTWNYKFFLKKDPEKENRGERGRDRSRGRNRGRNRGRGRGDSN
ncbi:E3 ubiquitin-protein ligase siah-1-like isoform X3 [Hyposmocoma kahamanoa]|nr:E3 ubiquitin-protein ligase siah-1-like isoform X3 [Hyposmocoma kahamanoa]